MPSISRLSLTGTPRRLALVTAHLTAPFLRIAFIHIVPAPPDMTTVVPAMTLTVSVPAPEDVVHIVPWQDFTVHVPEHPIGSA